jgi:hypothetical protein
MFGRACNSVRPLAFSGNPNDVIYQEKDLPQSANIPEEAASRSATVSKATIRAARLLGLTNSALATILGLSEPTISRLSSASYRLEPGSKPYELALLLIRLFRSLDAMVGGEPQAMRSWMRSQNRALEGIPSERIRSVTGLVEAVAYVDSARARI